MSTKLSAVVWAQGQAKFKFYQPYCEKSCKVKSSDIELDDFQKRKVVSYLLQPYIKLCEKIGAKLPNSRLPVCLSFFINDDNESEYWLVRIPRKFHLQLVDEKEPILYLKKTPFLILPKGKTIEEKKFIEPNRNSSNPFGVIEINGYWHITKFGSPIILVPMQD